MLGRIKNAVDIKKKKKPHIGIDEATGPDTPKIGLDNLLTEEPELLEALENTRIFLNKSASQVILQIYRKKTDVSDLDFVEK